MPPPHRRGWPQRHLRCAAARRRAEENRAMEPTRTVLFLCTGNYYRSRFAELLFNARISPEAGWRAESRGFEPSPLNPGPISSAVLERLTALGIPHPPTLRMPLRV